MCIAVRCASIDKPELENLSNKPAGFSFTEFKSITISFMNIYLIDDFLLQNLVTA